MDYYNESLKEHERLKGKLEVISKAKVETRDDLSIFYTPGVAQPCREIAKNPSDVWKYTIKGSTIAVVSDGSAVLGLGNIGAEAGLPVMEGKCLLFKEFAGINAFPICIKTQNPDEIINIVKNISPVFGGINLEDISAPRCFEIEEQLQELGIPVMHDDQHGTAVVVLAALINAVKVVNKKLSDCRVVVSGAGAGGTAITKLLLGYSEHPKDIILCDSKGIISNSRTDLNKFKQEMTGITNNKNLSGSLADALKNADIFVGVSAPRIVTEDMVRSMNDSAIVLAMANPEPEIEPGLAKNAGAAIVGTGRSDHPNQVNNVLGFPGIFKGALEAKATRINNDMKYVAAEALAGCVKDPAAEKILPNPLDKEIASVISKAVKKKAIETGVVRKE